MIQFLSEFKSLFEAILPVLLLVWLSYRIGLKKYFQEKENELIIKRYLENGVDKVATKMFS